jgi:hypothetical protein
MRFGGYPNRDLVLRRREAASKDATLRFAPQDEVLVGIQYQEPRPEAPRSGLEGRLQRAPIGARFCTLERPFASLRAGSSRRYAPQDEVWWVSNTKNLVLRRRGAPSGAKRPRRTRFVGIPRALVLRDATLRFAPQDEVLVGIQYQEPRPEAPRSGLEGRLQWAPIGARFCTLERPSRRDASLCSSG